MPNDVTKLPRWAQDQITALKSEARGLHDRLMAYEGEVDTPVFARTGHGDVPIPNEPIQWNMPNKEGFSRHIDIRLVPARADGRSAHLYVNAYMGLIIRPIAANACEIYMSEL